MKLRPLILRGIRYSPEQIVSVARARAVMFPAYTGHPTPNNRAIVDACTYIAVDGDYIVRLAFTRDDGMHSSGWWKNPDYSRCEHLSLSFTDRTTAENAPHDRARASAWCERFYPDTMRFIWAEPPFSDIGKRVDVWHYRVFLAEDWRSPILPRGEVYTREFIEMGWKSWSELHSDVPQESAHT